MKIETEKDIAEGVWHLNRNCSVMKMMTNAAGTIPLRLSTPDFKGLASIIVSQQVSKASAEAIFGRLQKLIDPLDAENFIYCGETAWIEAGLSRAKQRTLMAVSLAVTEETLDLGRLCKHDPQDALNQLTAIKGIGPWTAEVYLMFCAGHRDVFPAGDLALQEAIKLAFEMDDRPDDKSAREIAERWAPYRAVAARVLWAYYASKKRNAAPV